MATNSERIERLKELVRVLPQEPGVYLMKNVQGKIIYVGKAKNLRNRVRSYFADTKDIAPKTRHLVSHIETFEHILTKTEVEAFLLEATLIKKNRPRYNIRLRDDKAYPYIKLTIQQDFPRFYLSRRVSRDGSLYFGPFSRGGDVVQTIRFMNRHFRVRDCTDNFMRSRKRPCMTYQIGRCTGPCVKLVDKVQYGSDVESALLFLRGEKTTLVRDLTKKMKLAATDERFEEAGKWRDSIRAIESVLSQQAVVEDSTQLDQDVIGFFGDTRGVIVEVVHIRHGRIISSQPHSFSLPELELIDGKELHAGGHDPFASHDLREWLLSFINLFYEDNIIPNEIILPLDLGGDLNKLLKAVLEQRASTTVIVRYPTDRAGASLLEIAERNARESFKEMMTKNERRQKGLEEIQKRLQLPSLPVRIECYDISNFQGKESVASQVVFENGEPAKDQYRKYKIKTVQGANDFLSMKEVLSRRFKHTEYDDPDLVVIDGGKGQLKMAEEVLKELNITNVPIVGLAKARLLGDFTESDLHSSEERFFLPGRQNAITFQKNSEALRILTAIRDEAHRFAITYHRGLRENKSMESVLDSISGLGPTRKKALLKEFQSVDGIRQASAEQIVAVRGMNRMLAERILAALVETETRNFEIPTADSDTTNADDTTSDDTTSEGMDAKGTDAKGTDAEGTDAEDMDAADMDAAENAADADPLIQTK